jgi:hypothetical protein
LRFAPIPALALGLGSALLWHGAAVASNPPAQVDGLRLGNGGAPFAGDNRLVTTISPNGDGYRDHARISFRLSRRATVELVVGAVGVRRARLYAQRRRLGAGIHVLHWIPGKGISPRTYVVRVSVVGGSGPASVQRGVVRVLGIEAIPTRESYAPERAAVIRVASDEPMLTLQTFRLGVAPKSLHQDDATRGVPVSEPVTIAGRDRNHPYEVRIWVGAWPSGMYAARLTTPDGRTGYAPFVVRPRRFGEHRVAVVLPTYTWQAYNFRDTNGNGFGETWYEGRSRQTLLGRTFPAPGLPPHFRAYDLNFLVWLANGERRGLDRAVDFFADADLGSTPHDVELADAYDLIVFPGHHEYVTRREFQLIRRYRDRGGNLIFLSANNFYWKVVRHGMTLTRVARWRSLGRPEAALIGVQYVGSDRGGRKGPFVVQDVARAPWLFEGTGLVTGSTFGRYGIEIDATARSSPRGTIVLAEIPHLLGRRTAQMTYYETAAGAKVFAAGAFTLGGNATHVPVATLLDNLWLRLSQP